jgi:hypothetical protein
VRSSRSCLVKTQILAIPGNRPKIRKMDVKNVRNIGKTWFFLALGLFLMARKIVCFRNSIQKTCPPPPTLGRGVTSGGGGGVTPPLLQGQIVNQSIDPRGNNPPQKKREGGSTFRDTLKHLYLSHVWWVDKNRANLISSCFHLYKLSGRELY